MPNQSPSAADVKTRILYDRLRTLSKPRRISLKTSTRILIGVFLFIIGVALYSIILGHRTTYPKANAANVFTDFAFFAMFALIWLTMAGGTVRSVFRDGKLLANGDVAIAVIVSQEMTGRKSQTSRIEYEFKDAAGRGYTGKSNDETRELYEDVQTLVF